MASEICQRCGATLPAAAAHMRVLCGNCGAPSTQRFGASPTPVTTARSSAPVVAAAVVMLVIAGGAAAMFLATERSLPQGPPTPAPADPIQIDDPEPPPTPTPPPTPALPIPASAATTGPVRGIASLQDGDAIAGQGDIDTAVVDRMLRTRMSVFRACYEAQLRNTPALAGTVHVEFTIGSDGAVSNAHIAENTSNSLELGECVAQTVSRFRFLPGPRGGSVTFSYPFVFAPST